MRLFAYRRVIGVAVIAAALLGAWAAGLPAAREASLLGARDDGEPIVQVSAPGLRLTVSLPQTREGVTVPAVAATATGWTAVVTLLGTLAFTVVRASDRRGNRRALEVDLARLEILKEQLSRQVEVPPGDELPCLGRLALETTGEWPSIDQVTWVTAHPTPALVALGGDLARYVFTTAPPGVARQAEKLLGEKPRRARVYPIDAATAGITATMELSIVWERLAGQQGIAPAERILPRQARWYLYVVPQAAGGRRRWQRKRRPRLRRR